MKIKSQPGDADMVELDDWLARLWDDGNAEPTEEGLAEPVRTGLAEPAGDYDRPPQVPPAAPAHRRATAAQASARSVSPVPAAIGNQLRMPIAWCEMGSCISWHTDGSALGEADIRVRAIGAGWRVDALGRLSCPQCQQTASGFQATQPVVPWDRNYAITVVARMAAMHINGGVVSHARVAGEVADAAVADDEDDPDRPASGPATSLLPASPAEPGRHRKNPPAKAVPAGRHTH